MAAELHSQQMLDVACKTQTFMLRHVSIMTAYKKTSHSNHSFKTTKQSCCFQRIIFTSYCVFFVRTTTGNRGQSGVFEAELNLLVQTKGVPGLLKCRTNCNWNITDTRLAWRKRSFTFPVYSQTPSTLWVTPCNGYQNIVKTCTLSFHRLITCI